MSKIDFAALKSGVPIDAVLSHYGVQTRRRNNTYLVANCPLPTHTSKDSVLSFSINVEKNLWTCHSDSCKKASGMRGGDVIDLVCLMEGTRLPLEGAKRLAEWFPQNGTGKEETMEPHDGMMTKELFEKLVNQPQPNKPLAFTLKDINPEHPLIQSRGITVETATLFGVGYFPGKGSMAGRVVFPLYEDGQLIGYAGRLAMGDATPENPKWKLPPIHKTFLYNLERCDPAKLLILSESFWAPLYFHQRGGQCAALMGKDLTEAQEKRLKPFHEICVALDNDEPGREATQKIANKLRAKHKVFKAMLMEG